MFSNLFLEQLTEKVFMYMHIHRHCFSQSAHAFLSTELQNKKWPFLTVGCLLAAIGSAASVFLAAPAAAIAAGLL